MRLSSRLIAGSMGAYLLKALRTGQNLSGRCITVACGTVALLGSSSCGLAHQDAPGLRAVRASVFVLPDITGGSVGWCITEAPGLGCVMQVFRGPIVAEAWYGQSPPPRTEGFALTTSKVATVSVDGDLAIPTHREPQLPDGLRAVVVRAPRLRLGLGLKKLHFTPFDQRGRPMMQATGEGVPASTIAQGRGWTKPQPEPPGICALASSHVVGLTTSAGFVVTRVGHFAHLIGQPFLSCASNSYSLDGWQLVGSVLINAANPGSTPAALPGMTPLPGHPGVFQALAAEGEMLAQRIPGAWLVVARGSGNEQRLRLLEHLHGTVHL